MGKRPRIKVKKETVIVDELEFKPNCCSENARQFYNYEEIEIELWVDKHCHLRQILGDENGKREGIELEVIKDLVIRSFTYLLNLYLKSPNFKFIKYIEDRKRDIRTVLKETIDEKTLNIVIETHYLKNSKFEITIKTAMVVDNFRISDNQYVLFVKEKEADLKRFANKGFQQIGNVSI